MTAGFVVRALNWQAGNGYRPGRRLPGADVIASSDEPAEAARTADAFCRAVWARPGFNPFHYGGPGVALLSSFPDAVFQDWLLDHGVDPPARGQAWADWYAPANPDPMLVRDGLSKLRFTDVVPGTHAFVVTESHWRNTSGGRPRFEPRPGGTPVAAFATREAADADCARRAADTAARVRADPREVRFRPANGAGRGTVRPIAPFFTVVGAPADGGIRFLVGARGGPGERLFDGPRAAVVPDRLCATRERADELAKVVAAAARRTMNPFDVFEVEHARAASNDFARRFVRAGLTFPPGWSRQGVTAPAVWHAWYASEAEYLTDAERAAVWGLFGDPFVTVTDLRGAGPA